MEKATLQECRDWATKLRLYDTLSYTDVQTTLLILACCEGVLTLISLVVFLIPIKRIQIRSSWLIAVVLYGHFSLLSLFFNTANQRKAMTIDIPLVEAQAECMQRFNIKLPVSTSHRKYFEIQTRTQFHIDTIFIFACCCITGILFLRFFQIIADSKSMFNDIVDNFNTSFKPSFDLNEIYISQPPSVATISTTTSCKKKRKRNPEDDSSCDSQSTTDSSSERSFDKKEREKKEPSESCDSDLEIV